MELRAVAHHLGDIVAAGDNHGDTSSGSSAADLPNFGRGGGGGGGNGGRYGWGGSSQGGWGVEYAWSSQGGAGKHQPLTFCERMPQAIGTNYLRVRSTLDRAREEACFVTCLPRSVELYISCYSYSSDICLTFYLGARGWGGVGDHRCVNCQAEPKTWVQSKRSTFRRLGGMRSGTSTDGG